MNRNAFYFLGTLAIFVFFSWGFSLSNEAEDDFSERVKIALRDVGNQLLLTHGDSTSLILPVAALGNSKYELSFEEALSFEPGSLVTAIDSSFNRFDFPKQYRVEVIQCVDKEVAYSFEVSLEEEKTIIPCRGRVLPQACYTIEVRFIKKAATSFIKQPLFYFLALIGLLLLMYLLSKKKKTALSEVKKEAHTSIGSFQFFPEQNKLVKEAVEIGLSKKECELLAIFVAQPNQIVKRDELTKKVWEDNGVIVGRSLDTYISKLRKKLKDDDSIKLTNVHGVGYKLEILKK